MPHRKGKPMAGGGETAGERAADVAVPQVDPGAIGGRRVGLDGRRQGVGGVERDAVVAQAEQGLDHGLDLLLVRLAVGDPDAEATPVLEKIPDDIGLVIEEDLGVPEAVPAAAVDRAPPVPGTVPAAG